MFSHSNETGRAREYHHEYDAARASGGGGAADGASAQTAGGGGGVATKKVAPPRRPSDDDDEGADEWQDDVVEHDSFLNDPPTELLDQLAAIALCDDDSGTSDDEVGVAVDLRHRPAAVGQLRMLQSAATVNLILVTLISKGRGIVVPILRWT